MVIIITISKKHVCHHPLRDAWLSPPPRRMSCTSHLTSDKHGHHPPTSMVITPSAWSPHPQKHVCHHHIHRSTLITITEKHGHFHKSSCSSPPPPQRSCTYVTTTSESYGHIPLSYHLKGSCPPPPQRVMVITVSMSHRHLHESSCSYHLRDAWSPPPQRVMVITDIVICMNHPVHIISMSHAHHPLRESHHLHE